ncbi:MAG: sulfite reductase (NADPH) hemoprotein beta-component, partial [Gammaproteobacteria bacterium]
RKFKIAFTGSSDDRAAILSHDIGLRLVRNEMGETGFEIFIGGGLGRTPVVARKLRSFLPKSQLLTYLEAILRVYNLRGRRDNKYKARIKILIKAMGVDHFRDEVDQHFQKLQPDQLSNLPVDISEIQKRFKSPLPFPVNPAKRQPDEGDSVEFRRWEIQNTTNSRHSRYRSVYISLKNPTRAPGDLSATEMRFIASLAERFSGSLIRTTHTQNLLLPLVHENDLLSVWQALQTNQLSAANIATVQDIICCPGIEYCGLANTTSIPIALEIQNLFQDPEELKTLGDIQIKISGCMNACGHHHIGHIGILGVDKKGSEWFQITLGGRADNQLALGARLGPAVDRQSIAAVVESIIRHYQKQRHSEREHFLETLERIGVQSFRDIVYA